MVKRTASPSLRAIHEAIDEMMEQIKEMQRKEASRIVVPGVETTLRIITG